MTRRRSTRWVGACVAVAVLIGSSIGLVITAQGRAAKPAALPSGRQRSSPVLVERRALNESTVIRGSVVAVDPITIAPDSFADPNPVVTGIPHAAGATVGAGQVVLEVSGRPVILLQGNVPAYRDLRVGASGGDVAQLHLALASIGVATTDPPDVYGMSTSLAIEALYRSLGYEPPTAGSEAISARRSAERAVADAQRTLQAATTEQKKLSDPGSVLESQIAVSAAQRSLDSSIADGNDSVKSALIDLASAQAATNSAPPDSPDRATTMVALQKAQTALAAAQRSRDSAVAGATDQLALAQAQAASRRAIDPTAVQQADDSLAQAQSDLLLASAAAAVPMPHAELLYAPTATTTITAVGAAVGSKIAGTEPVLTLSGGMLAVQCDVAEATGRSLLGQSAVALDEDSTKSFPGTFDTKLGVTDNRSGGSASGQVSVLLRPADALPGELLGRELRVTARQRGTAGQVVAVPLIAIESNSDGSSSVHLDRSGRKIDVRLGVIADGWAELVDPPDSLRPGTRLAVESPDG